MNLSASSLYAFYRPSKCALRVYLKARGEPEEEPSPYEKVIERLGQRHEQRHLAGIPEYVDLRDGTLEQRSARTLAQIRSGVAALYHPMLKAEAELAGQVFTIVGEPDLLIRVDGDYLVRDCKMARRITENDHPEILRQVELYGWLYQQATGEPPVRLEVYAGTGETVEIPDDGGGRALGELTEIVKVRSATAEPETAVGWTWCGPCCFHGRCWAIAENSRDVALLAGVDRSLAMTLYGMGVRSYDGLLARFNEASLSEVRRPYGSSMRRVGQASTKILRAARAMVDGTELVLQPAAIPNASHYVIFDCEGLPPQLDELEKVFLWGMQVFGEPRGPYVGVTPGIGPDGDREGWHQFLRAAQEIFDCHGELFFVHWHHYERTKLNLYVDRFGDFDGTAARIKSKLLDLLPITLQSVVLPLPSYSLKVVEKHVGFVRTLPEANGDWAMAKYIEATETADDQERRAVLDQIRQYNREDLEATWAVLNWLMSRSI